MVHRAAGMHLMLAARSPQVPGAFPSSPSAEAAPWPSHSLSRSISLPQCTLPTSDALDELEDIGRRFKIGQHHEAPAAIQTPSSFFSRGPLGLDLQLSPRREESPSKVPKSNLSKRPSIAESRMVRVSSLLPLSWRAYGALETPSKLKKSVCFAESPRTGRVKTATKRFYVGEAIQSPGPPSLLESEDSIVSPLQAKQHTLALTFAQQPVLQLRTNESKGEILDSKSTILECQRTMLNDSERTIMKSKNVTSDESEKTKSDLDTSKHEESEASPEQDPPSMRDHSQTPLTSIIHDFGSFVLSFGKTYLQTPQIPKTVDAATTIPQDEDIDESEEDAPSPITLPAKERQYASWLRRPRLSTLSSPLRLFQSARHEPSNGPAEQLRFESLQAMKDSDSDEPPPNAFVSTNPFLDESEDELARDPSDHEQVSLRRRVDKVSDGSDIASNISEDPLNTSDGSSNDFYEASNASDEASDGSDENSKKFHVEEEPADALEARLSGLTIAKSPAILPSPRRSSRRLSVSRRYRAEKVQRLKAAADQHAREHGILRRTNNSMVPPLSSQILDKLRKALRKSPGEIVATTSTRIEISRRDIGKVLPQRGMGDDVSGWLNDEIIGAYLQCAVDYGNEKRRKGPGPPKYHAFNTFFYSKLSGQKGYDDVKRWATRAKIGGKELLKVEYVFVPINRGGSHWGLGVISPVRRTIEYYDSLHYSATPVYANIQKFLAGELGTAYKENEWRILQEDEYRGKGKGPSQDNGSDCGVFASTTAKMVVLGVDPCMVTARDMPLQRQRIVAEIIHGGFFGEMAPQVDFVYEHLA